MKSEFIHIDITHFKQQHQFQRVKLHLDVSTHFHHQLPTCKLWHLFAVLIMTSISASCQENSANILSDLNLCEENLRGQSTLALRNKRRSSISSSCSPCRWLLSVFILQSNSTQHSQKRKNLQLRNKTPSERGPGEQGAEAWSRTWRSTRRLFSVLLLSAASVGVGAAGEVSSKQAHHTNCQLLRPFATQL